LPPPLSLIFCLDLPLDRRLQEFPPHPRDVLNRDLLGANRFTFPMVRAVPEPFGIHLLDHQQSPPGALRIPLGQPRELTDLRTHEQRCRGIGTGRHTSAANDARRCVDGVVGRFLGHHEGVPIRRRPTDHRLEGEKVDVPFPSQTTLQRTGWWGKVTLGAENSISFMLDCECGGGVSYHPVCHG